jgi:adenylate cyclase
MAGALQVRVLDRQREVYAGDFTGAVELGRQSDSREGLYTDRPLPGGGWRVIIAPLDEDTISRQHAHLDPLAEGRVRLTNRSGKVPIGLSDGSELAARASCELDLPASLRLGRRVVEVRPLDRVEPPVRSLDSDVAPPSQQSQAGSGFPTLAAIGNLDVEHLLRLLQAAMAVLHSAATSTDFFQKAAQGVVDIVGCDCGRVLLLEDGQWKIAAVYAPPSGTLAPGEAPPAPPGNSSWRASRQLLQRVLRDKRTFWISPEHADPQTSDSLRGVEVVVASPILDRGGEVIGVLYGDCRCDPLGTGRARITELEARLVELLASGVATGLARMEQEKAAVEAEVRFGQFFTPALARQLTLQADLLDGRESEVSLLFADIRSFSRLSGRLGAAETVRLIGDVMAALSDCVLAHRGVLVDYIGDELIAMWGAPETQPDHARLACRAALDMLGVLPRLNEAWQGKLQEPLDLGIGVNTGPAWVGNVGTRHKFKYGPLGHTVNVASRVQGATKYLRARLLITAETKRQLGEDFATRRLCQVRVVNVADPLHLYELTANPTPEWLELKARYEQALEEFEQGRCKESAGQLGGLLLAGDGPAMVMCWRALHYDVLPAGPFDPVWDLPGK